MLLSIIYNNQNTFCFICYFILFFLIVMPLNTICKEKEWTSTYASGLSRLISLSGHTAVAVRTKVKSLISKVRS